jgi:hypothetical protein
MIVSAVAARARRPRERLGVEMEDDLVAIRGACVCVRRRQRSLRDGDQAVGVRDHPIG